MYLEISKSRLPQCYLREKQYVIRKSFNICTKVQIKIDYYILLAKARTCALKRSLVIQVNPREE
jgi:hypothetical protein